VKSAYNTNSQRPMTQELCFDVYRVAVEKWACCDVLSSICGLNDVAGMGPRNPRNADAGSGSWFSVS
jgi:hypothetical protein